jgi:hypothetical protein
LEPLASPYLHGLRVPCLARVVILDTLSIHPVRPVGAASRLFFLGGGRGGHYSALRGFRRDNGTMLPLNLICQAQHRLRGRLQRTPLVCSAALQRPEEMTKTTEKKPKLSFLPNAMKRAAGGSPYSSDFPSQVCGVRVKLGTPRAAGHGGMLDKADRVGCNWQRGGGSPAGPRWKASTTDVLARKEVATP